MASKRPKKFNSILKQQTLDTSWYLKRNSNSEYEEDNAMNNSGSPDPKTSKSLIKTPTKSFPRRRTIRSTSNITDSSQLTSNENISDDNEVIGSSQDTTESKLKRKIRKSLPRKSKTPVSTPLKTNGNNVMSTDTPNKNLSISDVYDVSSYVIKEEIDEMLYNVDDYGPIEMTHDLSSLISDTKVSSQILEYSPQMVCSVNMESITEEDENLEEIQQDPLFIDEKDKDNKSLNAKARARKRFNKKRKSKEIKVKERPKRACTSPSKQSYSSKEEVFSESETEDSDQDSLTEASLKKLKFLKVDLQHTVPPQHKIENNAGSRQLTEKQIIEFESYGPLRKGPFSKDEDGVIKRNWKNFCKIHDWNEKIVEPFLYMRHNNQYCISDLQERLNFVRFLANGLPWRSLYSVYFRFRNLYSSSEVKGKFTYEEDKIILKYMKNASKKGINNACAELAKILKRKRHSIWQHYEKLKKKHNLNNYTTDIKNYLIKTENIIESQDELKHHKEKENKQKRKQNRSFSFEKRIEKTIYSNVKWTPMLVKKFIDTLIEVTSCKELKDLEHQLISQKTWNEVENKTRIDCKILEEIWNFQLHMQLFCPKRIRLDEIKIKLIEYIYKKQIQCSEDIIWETVQLDFPGITAIFLSKLFEKLTQYAQTKIDSSEFNNIVEYLYKNHIPEIEKIPRIMFLPRLTYENGKIFCLDRRPEKTVPNRATHNPLCDEDEKR